MIVASDIDGVLADIEPELNRRISTHFGIDISEVKKDKFYMHDRFDIDPKEMENFLQTSVFNDDEFWLMAGPIEENTEALRKIYFEHEVVLVTGRHGPTRKVTKEWLRRELIPYHGLLMDSLQVKHRAMKYAGAELMIEDRYNEATTIATKGFRSYVVERHYNLEHKGKDDGIIWINDIHDVIKLENL